MARRTAAAPPLTADARFVVLHGDEEMLKRLRLAELEAELAERHGQVDRIELDGTRCDLADVMDEVRSYTLMGGYKLVVVRQAAGSGSGSGGGGDADSGQSSFVSTHRAALERYAQSPVDHATLVLVANAWRPGKLDKAVARIGAVIKCSALAPAAAEAWLIDRCASVHGLPLRKDAARTLVARLGPELLPLDNTLAKLVLMAQAAGDPAVTKSLVEQEVEESAEEKAYRVQEALLEAMGSGSPGGALEAVHRLIEVSDQPEVVILYFTVDLARKLALAAQARGAGQNEQAIGKLVGVWGRNASSFFKVAKRFDEADALLLLNQALAADGRSKSGLGTARRNLERLCVRLA